MKGLMTGSFVLCCISAVLFGSGCVGSPIHSTLTYASVKGTIDRNNSRLLKLRVGMMQNDVSQIMGQPERSEGYPWGSVWLYRTAITNGIEGGIYGAIDADFTPLVFDGSGTLQGWGRNYYQEYAKKYDITINTR